MSEALHKLRTFDDAADAPASAEQPPPAKPAASPASAKATHRGVVPIVVSAEHLADVQGLIAGAALSPLLVSAEQAAALAGVDRATWYRWHSAGLIPEAVRIGGTVRWGFDELRAWSAAGCPDRESWERSKRR